MQQVDAVREEAERDADAGGKEPRNRGKPPPNMAAIRQATPTPNSRSIQKYSDDPDRALYDGEQRQMRRSRANPSATDGRRSLTAAVACPSVHGQHPEREQRQELRAEVVDLVERRADPGHRLGDDHDARPCTRRRCRGVFGGRAAGSAGRRSRSATRPRSTRTRRWGRSCRRCPAAAGRGRRSPSPPTPLLETRLQDQAR